MSVSTEVQRTLVKSLPELWSELGSAEGLMRHLGEIGEIRVTKVEPENKVEWEADGASGVVQLKQSGWGTKVTLSLTRAAPVPELVEPEPAVDLEPAVETEPTAAKPKPSPDTGSLAPEPAAGPVAPEPTVIIEVRPEPVAEVAVAEPEPKLGFFARLFKRKSRPSLAATPDPEPEPELEPEIQALAQPKPVYPPAPPKPVEPAPEPILAAEPAADLAAELIEIETRMQQESTELLTAALDRLGAAHHRPFSRA